MERDPVSENNTRRWQGWEMGGVGVMVVAGVGAGGRWVQGGGGHGRGGQGSISGGGDGVS